PSRSVTEFLYCVEVSRRSGVASGVNDPEGGGPPPRSPEPRPSFGGGVVGTGGAWPLDDEHAASSKTESQRTKKSCPERPLLIEPSHARSISRRTDNKLCMRRSPPSFTLFAFPLVLAACGSHNVLSLAATDDASPDVAAAEAATPDAASGEGGLSVDV